MGSLGFFTGPAFGALGFCFVTTLTFDRLSVDIPFVTIVAPGGFTRFAFGAGAARLFFLAVFAPCLTIVAARTGVLFAIIAARLAFGARLTILFFLTVVAATFALNAGFTWFIFVAIVALSPTFGAAHTSTLTGFRGGLSRSRRSNISGGSGCLSSGRILGGAFLGGGTTDEPDAQQH